MKKFAIFVFLFQITRVFGQLAPVNLQIPMSDGQSLSAHLYQPDACASCPVILIQTPYNKNFYQFLGLPLGVGFNLNSSNYVFVILDWRGFWGSADAAYAEAPSNGEDGFDAVNWIAEQPWCNGNIGGWGPSALGVVQFETARQQPEALKCIVPLVAAPQQDFEDYFPGGALRTEYIETLEALGYDFGPLVIGNPNYNLLWQLSESQTFYPDEIIIPALMIGGWYDHGTDAMIDFFNAIRIQSPAADQHRLLMGPWVHGGSGQAVVGSTQQGELEFPNAGGQDALMALEFLDYHLRGIENGWEQTPFVTYYSPGENLWLDAATWPPSQLEPVELFLMQDQSLSMFPQVAGRSLEWTYDPQDPSPTIGGATLAPNLDQGPYDQAPQVESRDDVLVFTSAELTQPAVLEGKVMAHLYVSSDQPDTDYMLRLTDVYPDGRSILVSDAAGRLRFRNGFTTALEELATSGEVYHLGIEFQHTAISFPAGHRIRLDISSSNYPRFNRNMNTGEEMYPNLSPDTLVNPVTAINVIHASTEFPSHIKLPLNQFITSIHDDGAFSACYAFPNPACDFVFFSGVSTAVQAVFIDTAGKSVQVSVSASGLADVRGLCSGLYSINLIGSEVFCHSRIIISH